MPEISFRFPTRYNAYAMAYIMTDNHEFNIHPDNINIMVIDNSTSISLQIEIFNILDNRISDNIHLNAKVLR